MSTEKTAAIAALEDLLDRERMALLEGDFDILVAQLEEKQRLMDTLNALPDQGEDPDLATLQGRVQRNQSLLNSALEGIRSVASRMSALHQVRRSLDTYDESGRKTTIEGLRNPKMEKRA